MSLPSSRANTWCRLKNEVVASMVLALERAELGVGVDVDPGHRGRIDADLLRQRRPHGARAVARGIADLLAGEVLHAGDAGALEPIEPLRRIGIDVHHADGVETLAAEQQHARHVGEPELRLPSADLLGRGGGTASGLEIDVDAGLLVGARFQGIEIRRMIAAGDPIEREVSFCAAAGTALSATPATVARATLVNRSIWRSDSC
jgi:hypothetical protein